MPVFVKYRIFVSQLIEVVVSRNTVRYPKNKNKIKRRFLFRFGHTASIIMKTRHHGCCRTPQPGKTPLLKFTASCGNAAESSE